MTPQYQGITYAELSHEISELRLYIQGRFDILDGKLETHEASDNVVANRVTVIETQRAEESNQKELAATVLNRRATFKASLIAVAITIGARLIELFGPWSAHRP